MNCLIQGAPEGLLDRCTHVRIGHNKVPMSPAIKNEIMKLTKIYGTGMLKQKDDALFCGMTASFIQHVSLQFPFLTKLTAREENYFMEAVFRNLIRGT